MPSAKPSEADLSLIAPSPTTAPSSDAQSLYQSELNAFDSPDQDSDEDYERKIRRAFQVRQLRQFDTMVQSRKDYASRIFWLVVGWLISLGVIVFLVGWNYEGFVLDSKVLLALIGGTTLNVLGIFTIVTNFLFPKGGNTLVPINELIGPAKVPARASAKRTKAQATPADSGAGTPPAGG